MAMILSPIYSVELLRSTGEHGSVTGNHYSTHYTREVCIVSVGGYMRVYRLLLDFIHDAWDLKLMV